MKKTRREFLELSAAGATGVALASVTGSAALGLSAATEPVVSARDLVFSEGRIASLRLKNRLVRAATAEGASPDGCMNEDGLAIYHELAVGGVAMIITGHMVAVSGGDAHRNQTHIDDDSYLVALRRITDTIHRASPDCPVIAEISHAGPAGTVDPLTPWEVSTAWGRSPARVLTSTEVEDVIAEFVAATVRAKEAGFDGVEIHAAHGYLLASFLSPRINRRDDVWGGSPERRAAVIRHIVDGARKNVGPDYPLLIKMNSNDHGKGDRAAEGFSTVTRAVVEAGVDAIEVSGRRPCRAEIDEPDEEAYFHDLTQQMDVSVPVILTGGNRSLDRIASVLKGSRIGLVGLARPLIREPDLAARWRKGEGSDGATCISCNRCLRALATAPTQCVYDRLIREGELT